LADLVVGCGSALLGCLRRMGRRGATVLPWAPGCS